VVGAGRNIAIAAAYPGLAIRRAAADGDLFSVSGGALSLGRAGLYSPTIDLEKFLGNARA